jgi:hypothetical protein
MGAQTEHSLQHCAAYSLGVNTVPSSVLLSSMVPHDGAHAQLDGMSDGACRLESLQENRLANSDGRHVATP